MKRALTVLVSFSISVFAIEEWPQDQDLKPKKKNIQILLDTLLSPKAAGTSMLNVHQGIETAADALYDSEDFANPPLVRFTELFLGWMPLNQITTTTQHEIFGHGYRIRDLDEKIAKVEQYKLGIPLPYGQGGGVTKFSRHRLCSPLHDALISIGGVEGTSVLAHELKTKWFSEGSIDPKQAYTYLSAFHDSTLYTLSMDDKLSNAVKGHDIETYFYLIHQMYPGSKLTVNQLKALSLINCLDPMTYSSAKSLWHYVKTGKDLSAPNQLWNARLGFSPYGPEAYLEHHRLINGKPIYAYLKGGAFSQNRYYGCGVEHRNLFVQGQSKIGFRFDGWYQPQLKLRSKRLSWQELAGTIEAPSFTGKNNRLGSSLVATCNIETSDKVNIELHLGVKTSGYLPGESMKTAPIFRGAFNFRF